MPPSRLLRTLVVLTAVTSLAGCGGCGRAIDPPGPPPLPPTAAAPAPVLSSLVLPIAIPADEIGELVDEVIPQRLYATEGRPLRRGVVRARLDLVVRRRGAVRIDTRAGQLITHLPLRAEGRVRLVRGVSRPFETTFTVHAVTDLTLDSTWATQARTRGAFTWREKPVLSILGFDIDVSGHAERAMEQQLARLAPRIDALIEDRVDLRSRVERLWESLAAPVAVRQEPPVWLAVRPVDAFALPPESRGDTLVYGLGVRAFVETILGEPPPHALGLLPPLRALPDSLAGDALRAFQIHFPVSIPYSDANRLLTDALAGRDLPVHDDVGLRLDGVSLYGSADTLVARIDFRARLAEDRFRTRGRIFLTGTPTYDPAAHSIRVDGFDYDVHSQHALAEAADWFFRDDVLAQVRGRLVLPLTDRLADAQARLQEALTARAVGRHILLDAHIDTIAPGRLYLVEDGITLDVTARGRLTARVHALDALRRRDSTRAPPGG